VQLLSQQSGHVVEQRDARCVCHDRARPRRTQMHRGLLGSGKRESHERIPEFFFRNFRVTSRSNHQVLLTV
jgi:hypothetical protein